MFKKRSISKKEIRYLKSQRAALISRRARLWRIAIGICGLAAVLAGLTILVERNNLMISRRTDAIIIVAFWILIGTIIAVPTGIQEGRRLARRIGAYDHLILNGMCSALQITSKRMWEFEEREDEGACYAFELGLAASRLSWARNFIRAHAFRMRISL